MDTKAQRPTRARSTRARQDENNAVYQSKAVKADAEKPVGLKAAAKRSAFQDVSNKRAMRQIGTSANVDEKSVKAVLSKPAQRTTTTTTTTTTGLKSTTSAAPIAKVTGGPKRLTKKSSVYEDKRRSPLRKPSPKKASPKFGRVKNDNVKLPATRQNAKRHIVPSRPLSGLARVKVDDTPAYSDDQYETRYLEDEEDFTPDAEYDEDATDVEEEDARVDYKARFNPEVELLSDSEVEADESTYAHGDNTTGVTTQVLLPKWTSKARAEVAMLEKDFVTFDDEDEFDVSMVAEYGDEIFAYMRELELKLAPNPDYMSKQSEIQWSMRAILMDWLVQVHARFSLLPETMFLCANYIDRFLSCKVVSLQKLQLVGATALFVAAKYEEINCPSVHEIVYMVDGGYTAEEILKAERFMLSMLQFELGAPGPMSFLRRISKADDYDIETRTLAKYFLEITIMDERFVGSPPSFLAAGAHCLARHMLGKGDWTPAHVYYSGYTADQVEPLVEKLVECCENPKEHHNAIYEKYHDRRYKRASMFVANWMKAAGYIADE